MQDRNYPSKHTVRSELIPRMRQLRTSGPVFVAAVDVGTSKTTCVVAQLKPHANRESSQVRTHEVKILSVGCSITEGMKAGAVSNFERLDHSLRCALEPAEQQKFDMQSVVIAASGGRIASEFLSASIDVSGTVSDDDIAHVRAACTPNSVQNGRASLHCLANNYCIGRVTEILDPREMLARQLGLTMLVVTMDATVARDLMLALERCHVNTEAMVASAYAAGLSVLSDDEMGLGAAVIDLGAGTTNIGVFSYGRLLYTTGFALGGQHITRDLACGLNTSLVEAELIKTHYGLNASGDTLSGWKPLTQNYPETACCAYYQGSSGGNPRNGPREACCLPFRITDTAECGSNGWRLSIAGTC